MNTEKKQYFAEAAMVLDREGFRAEMFHGDKLSVWWDDEPLCEISDGGAVHYHSSDLQTPEQNEAKDRAYQITCTVFEYMRLMESAPPLKVVDLADHYKVLADFNRTVLAAVQSSQGVQFVTWDWDFNRKGVSHGHYFGGNYDGAKQDFATRSGLIPEQRIFRDEQLVPIYRACEDALEYGLDMTVQDRKMLQGVQEQIETALPDIQELLREPELTQGQTM